MRAVLVLLLVSALSLGAAGMGLAMGLGSGACAPRHLEIEDSGTLRITFVGDTMLGDAADPILEARGYDWPFDSLRGMDHGDVVIANAEGPITTLSEPFDPAQHWHYNAQPRAASAMSRAGIDAVSLGNNHAMDRGPAGLIDTIEQLDRAGISSFGAGKNTCEAEVPLMIRSSIGTVGIVGLGKYYGRAKMASVEGAGTVALSKASIVRGATLARGAGADLLIGFVHWGRSYDDVTPEQRAFAEQFAQAGFDLVIGTHPHVTQGVDLVEGMPVLYSIGNYVFGAPGRFTPEREGIGLVATAEITAGGLDSVTLRCIVTDNEIVAFQPRPCDPDAAVAMITTLNPAIQMNGDVGRLLVR